MADTGYIISCADGGGWVLMVAMIPMLVLVWFERQTIVDEEIDLDSDY